MLPKMFRFIKNSFIFYVFEIILHTYYRYLISLFHQNRSFIFKIDS